MKTIENERKTINTKTTIILVDSNSDQTRSYLESTYKLEGVALLLQRISKNNGRYLCVYRGSEKIEALLLVYAGECSNKSEWRQRCQHAIIANRDLLTETVDVDARLLAQTEEVDLLTECCRTLFLADYAIGSHKEKSNNSHTSVQSINLVLGTDNSTTTTAIVERAKQEAETLKSAWDLVNQPANFKTPEYLANWIKISAADNKYKCRILEKQELEKMGFHALLAVNQASTVPAKCLIGEYEGAVNEDAPTVLLVGKGITFDTGGISLKKPRNMHYMKSDMGGAAAVLGTIELASKLGLPVNLKVIVPTTDNSIGSTAVKPGDVIKSHHGSTIEVIDTDAEGRLVLADGISYGNAEFKPDYIIDLATLTGSVIAALGTHAAGLMTKNDNLAASLINSGEQSGDRLWRLPLWKEYKQYMHSDVADIANLSSKPMAGAITAGIFLEHFTDDHPAWAHIDIAGMAFYQNSFSKGYSATGFGILLLISWLEQLTNPKSQWQDN